MLFLKLLHGPSVTISFTLFSPSLPPSCRRSKSLTLQLLDEEDAEHLDPGHGRPRYRWRHRQQSLYSSQLFQSGLVVVYVTFWVWSAMQSAPEGPGFVELYFLVEEGDLVCYLPRYSTI